MGEWGRGVKDTRRSPGSGDVLTLRTRSLIGDDLWRHSIFRPSSKGNRRNKYGHRYVLPISRARGHRSREGGQMFPPGLRPRVGPDSAPDVEERFLAPTWVSTTRPFFCRHSPGFGEVLYDLSRPPVSRLWEWLNGRAYQARYIQARNLPRRLNPV